MALLLLNACSVACSVASVLVPVPPLLKNRKEMDIKKTGRSGGPSPVASCVAGPLVSLFFAYNRVPRPHLSFLRSVPRNADRILFRNYLKGEQSCVPENDCVLRCASTPKQTSMHLIFCCPAHDPG